MSVFGSTDLNRSYNNSERRIEAITTACEAFDHNEEGKHNVELFHGAAPALARLMNATNREDELRMILAATEMVFRGSPKSVTTIFPKLTGFLSNLLRLLERLERSKPAHAEVSMLNISRILYSSSRSSDLRSLMLRQPGMLRMLSQAPDNDDCRLVRIHLLANLSNCEDNKILLYEQENLLETVLRIAHLDTNAMARQYAAAALCEFSSAPANQLSMANDTVLGTTVKMVLLEKSAHTRESATTVLQNLAFPKKNRRVLVEFKQGVVLEALKQALSADPIATSRRRAAGALTNLVCEETAIKMGEQKGLLETLAIVATKDENSDVQSRAALALTKIGGLIDVKDSCHYALLDALVVASLSKASNSVTTVLRLKARNPDHREVLARHAGVMDTLCDILVAEQSKMSTTDRDNSIRAVMHLVNEDKNRKLLCNKTILSALVAAADATDTQDAAIRTLERLATEQSNRATMAHHEGLLVAVAAAVEREAVWEREGHASEFGRLAKPLLMSLLVAM